MLKSSSLPKIIFFSSGRNTESPRPTVAPAATKTLPLKVDNPETTSIPELNVDNPIKVERPETKTLPALMLSRTISSSTN